MIHFASGYILQAVAKGGKSRRPSKGKGWWFVTHRRMNHIGPQVMNNQPWVVHVVRGGDHIWRSAYAAELYRLEGIAVHLFTTGLDTEFTRLGFASRPIGLTGRSL